MSVLRKNKPTIVVEHITGRGVKSKKVTLTQSAVQTDVYSIMLSPSECIRVTVKGFK